MKKIISIMSTSIILLLTLTACVGKGDYKYAKIKLAGEEEPVILQIRDYELWSESSVIIEDIYGHKYQTTPINVIFSEIPFKR
jgi:hypothetical protein